MHQFTEKDIRTIKERTQKIVAAICGGSALLNKYIDDKTITQTQANDMITYIKANYLKIHYHPLPKELQPLIDIAQRRVKDDAATKAVRTQKPTRWNDGYTISYYNDDNWGNSWNDGYQ